MPEFSRRRGDYQTLKKSRAKRRTTWRESDFFEDSQDEHVLTQDFRSFVMETSGSALRLYGLYCLGYICISVVAFSFVFEHWSFIDSIYFAVTTFLTAGFGDLVPSTQGGRIFLTIFAMYGVILIGVFIGIVGHSISEAQHKTLKRLEVGTQATMLRKMFPDSNAVQQEETEVVDSMQRDIMQVTCKALPLFLAIAVLACILGAMEGWPLTTSLYFSTVLATTTGYGDVVPTSEWSKLYCILFLPFAVAVFTDTLGRIAGIYIQQKTRMAQNKFLNQSITLCDLRTMDANNDGKVSREEFISFMLVALQKVEKEEIDELKTVFESLDVHGSGMIEKSDLVAMHWRQKGWDILQEAMSDEEEEENEGVAVESDSRLADSSTSLVGSQPSF